MKNLAGTVNKRAFLYLLFVPTFVLYTLSLTGCLSTSPGIPNLYLVKVTASEAKRTILVGYFGMCGETIDAKKSLTCTPFTGLSDNALAMKLFSNTSPSTKDLIHFGLILATKICLPVISGAGVSFTLGALSFSFFRLRTKGAAKASSFLRMLKAGSLALVTLSCILSFGGALSITIAINAIQWLAESDGEGYVIRSGKNLQGIQWSAFALSILITLGLKDMVFPGKPKEKKGDSKA